MERCIYYFKLNGNEFFSMFFLYTGIEIINTSTYEFNLFKF